MGIWNISLSTLFTSSHPNAPFPPSQSYSPPCLNLSYSFSHLLYHVFKALIKYSVSLLWFCSRLPPPHRPYSGLNGGVLKRMDELRVMVFIMMNGLQSTDQHHVQTERWFTLTAMSCSLIQLYIHTTERERERERIKFRNCPVIFVKWTS